MIRKRFGASPKCLLNRPPRPGGSFVAANFCVSAEGHFLGSTEVGVSMWDSFAQCWRRLHDEGVIDGAELRAVSFPRDSIQYTFLKNLHENLHKKVFTKLFTKKVLKMLN